MALKGEVWRCEGIFGGWGQLLPRGSKRLGSSEANRCFSESGYLESVRIKFLVCFIQIIIKKKAK